MIRHHGQLMYSNIIFSWIFFLWWMICLLIIGSQWWFATLKKHRTNTNRWKRRLSEWLSGFHQVEDDGAVGGRQRRSCRDSENRFRLNPIRWCREAGARARGWCKSAHNSDSEKFVIIWHLETLPAPILSTGWHWDQVLGVGEAHRKAVEQTLRVDCWSARVVEGLIDGERLLKGSRQ